MYNHLECNVERPQTTSTTITDGRFSLVVFTPVVNSVGVDALHDSGDAKISTADQHHNPATLYTSVTANCCSAAAAVYRYHQTKAGLASSYQSSASYAVQRSPLGVWRPCYARVGMLREASGQSAVSPASSPDINLNIRR